MEVKEEDRRQQRIEACVVVRREISISAHAWRQICELCNRIVVNKKSPDRHRSYILTNPIKIKTNYLLQANNIELTRLHFFYFLSDLTFDLSCHLRIIM